MKKRLLYLVEVIVTILLIVLMVEFCGHLLDPIYTEDGISTIDAFHALDDRI